MSTLEITNRSNTDEMKVTQQQRKFGEWIHFADFKLKPGSTISFLPMDGMRVVVEQK